MLNKFTVIFLIVGLSLLQAILMLILHEHMVINIITIILYFIICGMNGWFIGRFVRWNFQI